MRAAHMRLVYVDREQLAFERQLEAERRRYLGEGRCYYCDQIATAAGGVLAGMLVCVPCADKEQRDLEALDAQLEGEGK